MLPISLGAGLDARNHGLGQLGDICENQFIDLMHQVAELVAVDVRLRASGVAPREWPVRGAGVGGDGAAVRPSRPPSWCFTLSHAPTPQKRHGPGAPARGRAAENYRLSDCGVTAEDSQAHAPPPSREPAPAATPGWC